jgi:hypothetical protein
LAKKAPPPIALIEPRRVHGRRGWGRKNRRESRKIAVPFSLLWRTVVFGEGPWDTPWRH